MIAVSEIAEIFLGPGDYHFGGENTRIVTVLGSCISIAAWHPSMRIGGMCHYVLPDGEAGQKGAFDGRYADTAMNWLLREMHRCGTSPRGYRIHVFGGSCMFAYGGSSPAAAVGARNIEAARALLNHHGFPPAAADVGGASSRRVVFDFWSGRIEVVKSQATAVMATQGSSQARGYE